MSDLFEEPDNASPLTPEERDAARAGNVADISGLRREMADEMVKLKLNNNT